MCGSLTDDDDDDDAEFDGEGEGAEEDWGDEDSLQVTANLDDLESPKPKLHSSTPKYVLNQFKVIKERHFDQPGGAKSVQLYDNLHTFWAPHQDPAFLHPTELTPEHLYNP